MKIRLVGENLLCRIGAAARLSGGQYQIEDHGSRLEIGACFTAFDPLIFVAEGGSVVFGSDCLVAYGADLRNSDAHAILDASTQARLNPAADVILADHVWIGNQVQILKGVTIGSGSVVAARSVVTRSLPAGIIAAGNPARVIRENITWTHERTPAAPGQNPI